MNWSQGPTGARRCRWALVVTSIVLAAGYLAQGTQAGTGNQSAQRLLFVRGADTGGGIFDVQSDARRLRRVTSGRDEAPAWSGATARLAFVRTRDGRSYDVYVTSPGGRRPRAITHGQGIAQAPSWAPDGSSIVFQASGGRFGRSRDPSCTPNLWVIRPDGASLRLLVPAGTEPAYSPDGRRIAFVRPDAREEPWVYVVSASGLPPHRLGIGSHPSWSPDGRRLVVERPAGANRIADLWVLRLSDGRATRLTLTPTVSELSPAWSPDGRWIAFSAVAGARQNIYVLPVFGGGRRQVTRAGPRTGDFDPAWQPVPGTAARG